jgi:polyhydroxyalkanoate synthesis regulator phasin
MRQPKAFQFLAGVVMASAMVLGCSKGDYSASEARSPVAMAPSAAVRATSAVQLVGTLASTPIQPKKIIYKADATLNCENLDKATQRLLGKVKALGGYVGDASTSGARGAIREATYTVRVPVDRYQDLIKALPGIGELEGSSQKAQDVSEEFYDAQARLKNKYVEESRLIDLLKNRSARVSDILVVEKELSRVREEIERIEGRIRYLANQADVSTVTVTLREVKDFVPQGSPSLRTRTGRAFGGSIDSMKDVGSSLLLIAVAAAPWVLPLAIIVWIGWRLANRKLKPVRRVVIRDEP